jgi:hypothetical protein
MNRKQVAKECFKMMKYILDSGVENAVELTNTPNGYKGTDNMTDKELIENHVLLKEQYDKLRGTNIRKLKTKYGQPMKCICGCNEFRITYKDKSYLSHCIQCGMFCGLAPQKK